MNILFLFLIISNIILFIGLIKYYSRVGININLEAFDELAAIIATIIMLGYISQKLPKIKDMGDSPFYGMTLYLFIICGIGLMTSYFNGKFNAPALFGQYLEMFKVLSAVLIFVLLATHLKSFKEVLRGEYTRKNQIVCLIVFLLCGLFASYAHTTINDTPANIRCLIVMISGLFGGPIVGIPVGIVSGLYRYTLGGMTAVPCAISTVISGIIGSLIFIWNDKKFPNFIPAVILMFLFTGFEMLLIVLMTPPDVSFPFISDIYPKMLFASVIGIILFSIVIKETKEIIDSPENEEENEINELKNELKEHDEKIEELKNEIRELKKEKMK